jgi:hypothetical protein
LYYPGLFSCETIRLAEKLQLETTYDRNVVFPTFLLPSNRMMTSGCPSMIMNGESKSSKRENFLIDKGQGYV